ncbi:MAG: hypothetical protein NC311_00460 [Muribaculaceae bacterium]|nr:hypothetical protein [Muribaculaceae bacterium]MCM1441892.1 hypothetical protein [Roseburia sp.]
MMMINEIRTIKVSDAWIYEDRASRDVAASKCRRNSDVERLPNILSQRQCELSAELQKMSPNMSRVANLRRIIGDLQRTVNSVQRVR